MLKLLENNAKTKLSEGFFFSVFNLATSLQNLTKKCREVDFWHKPVLLFVCLFVFFFLLFGHFFFQKYDLKL